MSGENRIAEMNTIPTAANPSAEFVSNITAQTSPINPAALDATQMVANENAYLITERKNACLNDMRRPFSSTIYMPTTRLPIVVPTNFIINAS